MNKLAIQTAYGQLDILNLNEFIQKIPMEIASHHHVQVLKFVSSLPKVSAMEESLGINNIFLGTTNSSIEVMDFKLGRFGLLTEEFITHCKKEDKQEELEQMIKYHCREGIRFEFNSIIAKKQPNCVIKDMNTEQIYNLSSECMRNFGVEATCGVEHNLSQFQRFFILANPEDFKFYYMTSGGSRPGDIQLLGKLVDLYSDRWVMARFQNNEIRKELNSQLQYFRIK